MPVPSYLSNIAYDISFSKETTTFNLKCECGCYMFDIYESYLTKEEKELCKPYRDAIEYSILGGPRINGAHCSMCTKDENGVIHHWILLTEDKNGPKEEVIIPPEPACATVYSIKVKCSKCGKEYIIFDNRFHGYDGLFGSETSEETKNYTPQYKQKKRRDNAPVKVQIKVENVLTLEVFRDSTGIECSYEDYTNAYSWIIVYTIDGFGKKRKIIDYETA